MFVDLILLAVFVTIVALVVTVFMHATLGVPYVPTSGWIGKAMVEAAKLKDGEVVYDLGAGDGRILMLAKKRHPGIRAVGYEIVPTVWLLARIRAFFTRSDVRVRLRSAFDADLKDADVLLLYMTSQFLAKLKPKLDAELRKGARIVSHAFRIPGATPVESIRITNGWRKAVLNVYEWQGE